MNKYIFQPNKRFLGIEFEFSEKKVIEILGHPDKITKETHQNPNNTVDFDIIYYYYKQNIEIMFYYYDNIYNKLAIFTRNLMINNIEIFKLKKREILEIISKISNYTLDRAFIESVRLDDNLVSEQYDFDDIGITLWFENDRLNEICLFKV